MDQEPELVALGIESSIVNVNGVNLHCLSKGHGPLLLLLHGFPEYSGLWLHYLTALSDTYRVVAPDLRGYNLSDQPAAVADYAVPILVDDIVALVAALGEDKVYLAGHDWGALLSWYVADAHPALVRKLAVMNGPHPAIYQDLMEHDLQQKFAASYVGLLTSPMAETVLSAFHFKLLQMGIFKTSSYPFTESEKQGFLSAWGRGLTGPLNYYRDYVAHHQTYVAGLRGIKSPTLVLWGQKDRNISEHNLAGLERHVDDLRIVRYPNATHWLTYDEQESIIQHMRQFFSDV